MDGLWTTVGPLREVSLYRCQIGDQTAAFKTADGVFVPTATTSLLIEGVRADIRRPGRLLDLGCGAGVVGIVLAKLGLAEPPIYASDVSVEAAALTRENAADHACSIVVKAGSVFEPWGDEQFDYIVDDVSGIAESIAAVSPWFAKGVPCVSGKDGTALITQVIRESTRYLRPDGCLYFPVLSLSNTDAIIRCEKRFRRGPHAQAPGLVLPKELMAHHDLLRNFSATDRSSCRNNSARCSGLPRSMLPADMPQSTPDAQSRSGER